MYIFYSRYGTISSLKTDVTGISLAKSLASSNCMTYSEEYIIKDDYCGIELIEKRIPSLHSLARQDEQLLRRLEEDGEPPLKTSNNFTLGMFSLCTRFSNRHVLYTNLFLVWYLFFNKRIYKYL